MTVHGLLIFLVVLAMTGLGSALIFVGLMTRAILCPPRMTDGKATYLLQRLSPGDLGLVFDFQSFDVRDARGGRLKMASWWIPAPNNDGRCVVLIHGYADAKVGAIAWAPLLHRAGLNVLAIDLRAHGESDGTFCTGGYFERDDVQQILGQLQTTRPLETGRLFLFGVSLGAAVAAAVAAGRTDIQGVILESPFADYRRAIAAHARVIGLPGGLMLRAAVGLAEWLCMAKFKAVRPADMIRDIICPVLAIVGGDDPLLDRNDIDVMAAAVQHDRAAPGSNLWVVPEAGHLTAVQVDPAEYQRRVEQIVGTAV